MNKQKSLEKTLCYQAVMCHLVVIEGSTPSFLIFPAPYFEWILIGDNIICLI